MPRKLNIYILLFVASALLYISFMSIGLDYFDSFEYAFALEKWETALIHVHPPGYPIYVYIAKAFHILTQDTRLALTLLSAISGAIGIALIALTPATYNHHKAGLIAGLILIFLPGYWFSSEYPLGDVTGTTFTLAAMIPLLSVKSSNHRRNFIIGCFIAGLSLGVRPQNAIPVVMAGLIAIAHLLPLSSNFIKTFIMGFVVGLIGVLMWVIPIYQTFDGYNGYQGFDAYFQRLEALREHNQSTDSLLSQDLTLENVTQRINNYIDGWVHLIALRNEPAFLAIMGLMLIGLMSLPIRQKFTWFVLLWFIAETLKVFMFASLERPRLYLPALIPLVILVGLGYSNLRGKLQILKLGIIGLMTIFLWLSVPFIQQLNIIPPPPEQATSYIRTQYAIEKGSALVVSQGSFQAAQYHLSEYQQLYTPYFNADQWSAIVRSDQPTYIIVLDGDNIAPIIFDALTSELNYVTIDDRVFERDPRIFPQHATVRLQVFTQEANLQPEQLELPELGIINTSNPAHGKYFGEGWYRIEDIGGTPSRWTNQTAVIRVSLPPDTTTMSFIATPYLGGQTVEIIVNGTPIEIVTIDQVWGTYQITIPQSAIVNHEITKIEFHHELAEYPENHNRRLATAYQIIQFTSES